MDLEQVDTLLESALAPSTPMSAPQEGVESSVSSPDQVATDSAGNQWVITHEGKEIPLDEHKYKMYAQKGYNYEGKMHQLRVDRNIYSKEREEFETQKASHETQTEELRRIDEYARQNPQWLEHVKQSWLQAQQQSGQYGQNSYQTQNPYTQQISRLETAVNQLLSERQAQQKDTEMRAVAEKDAKLESSIAEYKDSFPDFDWEKADETGLKLDQRVMQHAIDNGIKSFKAAARDFLWDEHMSRAQINTKEKVGKEIQKQQKLGLGTPTAKSQMQVKRTESVRGKSYDDIASEALRELGL